MRSKAERIVLVLALLGVLVAAYALTLHYDSGGSVCDINDRFNCDTVNKSQWSELFGIPVALLGLFSYLLVTLLVLKRRAVQAALDFTARDFWQYSLVLVAVMFAFQAYLTFVEAYFLKTYCLACLASQAIVLALLFVVAREWRIS